MNDPDRTKSEANQRLGNSAIQVGIGANKAAKPSSYRWFLALSSYLGLIAVLALILIVFGTMSDRFLSLRTLMSIANQVPELTVITVGMTLVLIVGGIDLSVGSLLALSTAFVGCLVLDLGWPYWCACFLAVLIGSIGGFTNGLITVQFGIPSFIVTLGMLEVARGSAYLITDSQTKYLGSSVGWFGAPIEGIGVSPAFFGALLLVAAMQLVLNWTVAGRYWIAIGTNEQAVRMAGIDARPYRLAVFVLSGTFCGIAGVVQSSRLGAADPNSAVGMELAAIAAAVIGGTSLMGGRGSVIHSFLGVLIIATLQSGLASIGATEPTKRIVTGLVIVVAVLIDALRTRKSG